MPNINIICQGTLKEEFLRGACREYEKRLSAFCRIGFFESRSDLPDALYEKVLQTKGKKIALCVEGKEMPSEELAHTLDSYFNSGSGDVSFIIGGSDGLSERVKALCDLRLSFSKMTFPHQLMRVILLEQIYRAFTIIKGKTYHK